MKKTRNEEKKMNNVGEKIKKITKLGLSVSMVILIYILAPKMTLITNDIIKYLYELNPEYITRFWAIVLALLTTFIVVIHKNKKEEK